jgi:hypothetical protein
VNHRDKVAELLVASALAAFPHRPLQFVVDDPPRRTFMHHVAAGIDFDLAVAFVEPGSRLSGAMCGELVVERVAGLGLDPALQFLDACFDQRRNMFRPRLGITGDD